MTIGVVFLVEIRNGKWQLFSYKGHAISEIFLGSKSDAEHWGKAWISGFNWKLIVTGETMRKKAEFLERLFDMLNCKLDLLDFLESEKVVTYSQKMDLLHTPKSGHAGKIVNMLHALCEDNKLQLVSYDWVVLPSEVMKLSIVTDNMKKEFTYSV